jgi:hypothetical protein
MSGRTRRGIIAACLIASAAFAVTAPAEEGTFAMPEEPGLGPSLDEAKMEKV